MQSEVGVRNRKFNDLAQLIQQYIQRGENNGLACSLLHPVIVEPDDDETGRHSEFCFYFFSVKWLACVE